LAGNQSAHSRERGTWYDERIELHSGVGSPHGIDCAHCTHSDGPRAHAGHRKAFRCPEAHGCHSRHRDPALADPRPRCNRMVWYVHGTAPQRRRDRAWRSAVAATATGITEQEEAPSRLWTVQGWMRTPKAPTT
jgi:hypothetical protein